MRNSMTQERKCPVAVIAFLVAFLFAAPGLFDMQILQIAY